MGRASTVRDRARNALRRPAHWTHGLNRYAEAHAASSAADALVAVSLADSLFFSISPNASRDQVLLYLVVNMVPFTLLAPLIGPVIDRFRGSYRVIAASLFVIRAVLAVGLAFTLFDLTLFFFALALLAAGKASGVTRQALVPGLVESPEFLVSANSRLARISLISGSIGGATGVALLAATSPRVTLALACVGFIVAALVSTRLPATAAPVDDDEHAAQVEYLQLHAPLVSSTSWAFTVIRAAVGFFVFTLAFSLRRASEPTFLYAAAAVAYALGTFAGHLLAPAARKRTSDDQLTSGALVALAVVASFGALGPSRAMVLLVSCVLGAAASLGRQGFDALVQTQTPLTSRGSVFARFETRFQLGWVAGAVAATAANIPIRFGMAAVAVVMAPAALFYLRDVYEASTALAGDPFNPLALARRRLESLNTLERRDHVAVAAIELASVADLVRAGGHPLDTELTDDVDRMRDEALAGALPDPDRLDLVVRRIATAVAALPDPRADAVESPGAKARGRPLFPIPRISWRGQRPKSP